jgi:hypothetical protein
MAKIISARKFDTTIGPVRFTGILFLADPRSDSFATGDAEILGFESVNFEVRLEDPPLENPVIESDGHNHNRYRHDGAPRQGEG